MPPPAAADCCGSATWPRRPSASRAPETQKLMMRRPQAPAPGDAGALTLRDAPVAPRRLLRHGLRGSARTVAKSAPVAFADAGGKPRSALASLRGVHGEVRALAAAEKGAAAARRRKQRRCPARGGALAGASCAGAPEMLLTARRQPNLGQMQRRGRSAPPEAPCAGALAGAAPPPPAAPVLRAASARGRAPQPTKCGAARCPRLEAPATRARRRAARTAAPPVQETLTCAAGTAMAARGAPGRRGAAGVRLRPAPTCCGATHQEAVHVGLRQRRCTAPPKQRGGARGEGGCADAATARLSRRFEPGAAAERTQSPPRA